MRARALLFLCLWWGGLCFPAQAQRSSDYALDRDPWNAIGELLPIARETRTTLFTPDEIDLLDHPPSRGLLLLYPAQPPDLAALRHHLDRGGRIIWLDDFGASAPLWDTLGISRHLPDPPLGLHLLTPEASEHPLLHQVESLWLNHPVGLSARPPHEPLLALPEVSQG